MRAERTRGPFHLRLAAWNEENDFAGPKSALDIHGAYYRPPHPSMVAEDIEGATYAYDDGTHWLFAHCSPQEQLDFASDAEQFCYAAFAEYIDRALNSAQTGANTKARALVDFAQQASRDVFNTVRNQTLGYYHRKPHNDHRRDLAHASIVKVWTAWLKKRWPGG